MLIASVGDRIDELLVCPLLTIFNTVNFFSIETSTLQFGVITEGLKELLEEKCLKDYFEQIRMFGFHFYLLQCIFYKSIEIKL